MKNLKKWAALGLSFCMIMNYVPAYGAENNLLKYKDTLSTEETVNFSDEQADSANESNLENESNTAAVLNTDVDNTSDEQNTADEVTKDNVAADIQVQSDDRILKSSGKCGENAKWALYSDGTFEVSGSGDMYTYQYVSKDDEVNCGWGSWNDRQKIKKVVIGEGITSIGACSFYECEQLTEVTIPSTVKAIGNEAFRWCPNLVKVSIPDITSWCHIEFENENANPLRFGAYIYVNGVRITDIVVPDGITEIKAYAFAQTSNARQVNRITEIKLQQ